jgi:hypothetical protein
MDKLDFVAWLEVTTAAVMQCGIEVLVRLATPLEH